MALKHWKKLEESLSMLEDIDDLEEFIDSQGKVKKRIYIAS